MITETMSLKSPISFYSITGFNDLEIVSTGRPLTDNIFKSSSFLYKFQDGDNIMLKSIRAFLPNGIVFGRGINYLSLAWCNSLTGIVVNPFSSLATTGVISIGSPNETFPVDVFEPFDNTAIFPAGTKKSICLDTLLSDPLFGWFLNMDGILSSGKFDQDNGYTSLSLDIILTVNHTLELVP